MTLRVERQPDGRHAILNGSLIVDVFDTNEAAWRALDRLCGENISPSASRASWGFLRAAHETPYGRPVEHRRPEDIGTIAKRIVRRAGWRMKARRIIHGKDGRR